MYESPSNVSTCPKDKPILRLPNNIKFVLHNTGTSLRVASEHVEQRMPVMSTRTSPMIKVYTNFT